MPLIVLPYTTNVYMPLTIVVNDTHKHSSSHTKNLSSIMHSGTKEPRLLFRSSNRTVT